MSLFCSGCSLEETSFLCLESVLGTALAILNAVAIGHIGHIQAFPHFVESGLVVTLSVAFVAIACLLPLSESSKQYTVGLTAYFSMDLLKASHGPVLLLCMEYMSVSLLGSACALFVYSVPLPGLHDTRALKSSAAAFTEIAEGCAEVVKEAAEAFLCTGGDAWRALAQQRLTNLTVTLSEAKSIAGYENLSPLAAWRSLRSSAASARQHLQQETAFTAAAETLDVCCLLCELASRPHGMDGAEAALVRGAAEASILRVALGAAALLRDFGRENIAAGESIASATRRKLLREAAKGALQNSSAAAQELLLLKHFQTQEVLLGTNSFANARSEMASFLFLVHVLATELLQSEASFMRKAGKLDRLDEEEIKVAGDEEDGLGSLSTWNMWNLRESKTDLRHPLLQRRKSSDALVSALPGAFNPCVCQELSELMLAALHLRWRSSLKVSLSYGLALILDYTYGLDSVLVCTVAYLCSYGSQYSGGSLRRAILRGVGVSAGATVGSVLRTLCVLSSSIPWQLVATLLIMLAWTFLSTLVNFRGGPYAYAGFCAAFTAIKFLSSTGPGGIQLSTTITSSMWACLLAVVVETCVLPIDARDLLQGRIVAGLVGVWAVLPALVTADESVVMSVKEDYGRCKTGVSSWPDLTERLKKAGAYDKYLEWREGYMRWRMGESSGAKGEIAVLAAKSVPAPKASASGASGPAPRAEAKRCNSEMNSFQPRDPAPHFASKHLEENTPKEGIQLAVAMPEAVIEAIPEVTAVIENVALPMQMQSLKVLLEESEMASTLSLKRVSLASIQEVLDEIQEVLAPTEELALQAAERLDGLKLDGNAWCSLADRLRIMRLWLTMLGRITKRLGHGCSLTDLIGRGRVGEASSAAEDLLLAVGETLTATARCVAGAVPLPRECTKLEARLRTSRQGLLAALSCRVSQGRGELAAEVLSLSAGHALMALLGDAGRCLALSVRIVSSASHSPDGTGISDSPKRKELERNVSAMSQAFPALPDLTERLKQQGQYEKYIKWREGYMQWRSGGISGSKGEIVENSTT